MLNSTLAAKLTTEFASVTTAYGFDIIVTDDIQLYDSKLKEGNKSYIPCVLTTVTSFKNENQFIEVFQYQLQFAVDKDYRDDFMTVLDLFRATQVEEVIEGNYVLKTTQRETFTGEDRVKSKDYLFYNVILNWTYSQAFTGRNAAFYIKKDTEIEYVSIPYIQYQPTHDITYVSNQSEGSSYRLTNDLVIMQIPLLFSNAKVLELYNRINNDSYNAVYDLKIVTGAVEIIKQVALKKGIMTVTKDSGLAVMQLTFETHYPRKTITLDGDTIPVVAFQSTKKKTIEPDNKYVEGVEEDKGYGVATNFVRSFNIKFVKNSTTAWNKLEADHEGSDLDTPYTLLIDGNSYNVMSSETTESFTDTGDLAIEVSFVEKKVA